MMQKRSLTIAGHRTSIALEPEFWAEIDRIAQARHMSLAQLIAEIDAARTGNNLSSEIRLCVLKNVQNTARQN